jgi:2,3-bisphosphoglycerate-independent phosphoglycerate mutase
MMFHFCIRFLVIIVKYVIIIGDGMADIACEELHGKTPLQVAHTPHMDSIASRGRNGLLRTVPPGLHPDSAVANLSILGYGSPHYVCERGPLEAASLNISLEEGEYAFRCNLISVEKGHLIDYTGGRISTSEAAELIQTLHNRFKDRGHFYVGTEYRHVFVSPQGRVTCTPPHNIVGKDISQYLVRGDDAHMLNEVMLSSLEILTAHRINQDRIDSGIPPANMIWLWGQDIMPRFQPFTEKYGITGSIISAVDIIRGMGVLLGLSVIEVPGVTGYVDTNYRGKADHALKVLEEVDLVYVHVEAPDEKGHEGDVQGKIEVIEQIDAHVVGRLLDGLNDRCTIAVLPDHPTPCTLGVHTADPVPFAIWSPSVNKDEVRHFDELSARKGGFGLQEQIMPLILGD